MKTITTSQLRAILANLRGATPIAFTALTSVTKMRARVTMQDFGSERIPVHGTPVPWRNPSTVENPFVETEVKKLARVQAFTGNGFHFTPAVHRQQVREGQSPTFKAEERSWGEQITAALVKRTTKGVEYHYLSTQIVGSAKARQPVYFVKSPEGILRYVARHVIEPFLLEGDDAAKQQLEKPVIRRDYRLDHIRSLTLKGETYRIIA